MLSLTIKLKSRESVDVVVFVVVLLELRLKCKASLYFEKRKLWGDLSIQLRTCIHIIQRKEDLVHR